MYPFILLFSLLFAAIQAEEPYVPSESNLEARKWFQDNKFGLFVHWGVYSVLEKGEWVLFKDKMTLDEYETLPSHFNPELFDPVQWVAMVKDAGMKYIVITSRHHDGFSMWGTSQNKWNIVDATPYKKDVLKLLAEEATKEGIKLFFYYSQLDWRDPNYYPVGKTGYYNERSRDGDFNRYLDFMDAQLTELLTGYGDIGGIWFDGMWDKPDANWRLRQTYDLIHTLQPVALIGSNHHLKPIAGEDFQMFEKDLPGQNTALFNQTSIDVLPLETCETMNLSWGYNSEDQAFKSSKDLIQYLVKAAGNNANFLLNVGPKPDGTIQKEFTMRLKNMGQWMRKNGASIDGTRGGPMAPASWGVMTQKEDRVYLHILDPSHQQIELPDLGPILKARIFPNGPEVVIQDGLLDLSQLFLDSIDTIVEIELDCKH